jgi:hypothetical protein
MSLPIPNKTLLQHIIALGKTGSGKSSALRLLVENLLRKKKPVIIVTPKADWWGLKSSANGKGPGFPIVVFGGDHQDMPLNPRSGIAMAELLATGNRSAVLQMRDWMPADRTQFWIDFASALFRFQKGTRWLVIDEVHNFSPKGKVLSPQAGEMIHWSNKLAAESRGLGLNLIVASQRPAKVHNDLLTSCETLIAMRVIHKSDRDAIEDWIEGCGDEKSGALVLKSLAQMKRGDAWVWSPENDFGPKQVHFPMFKTFDSFKPQASRSRVRMKGWAGVNLAEVKTKLEAFVKEAEANDPQALKDKVRHLTIALSIERKKAKDIAAQTPTVAKSLPVSQPKPLPLPKPLSKKERLRIVKAAFENARLEMKLSLSKLLQQLFSQALAKMQKDAIELRKSMSESLSESKLLSQSKLKEPQPKAMAQPVPKPQPKISKTQTNPVSRSLPESMPESQPQPDKKLMPGERAILLAIAQKEGKAVGSYLTAVTGYQRSSRNTYLANLKKKGFITQNGEGFAATAEGLAELGDYEHMPPNGLALQAWWSTRLMPGELKILRLLIAHGGKPVEREALDEAGLKRSSRNTYLSSLMAKELVQEAGRGMVKASELLYDEY